MNMLGVAAAAFLACAAPVAAQGLATSAIGGLDNRAPIDVDADRIELLERESQALFTGNVRVRQGALTLEANRTRVAYERRSGGDPEIRRLDADGNVRITTPSERATARFGIYDVDRRLLTLIGNVVVTRGTTRVAGNRLVIDLASGMTTLDGQASAGGQGGGRVSGRFAVPAKR